MKPLKLFKPSIQSSQMYDLIKQSISQIQKDFQQFVPRKPSLSTYYQLKSIFNIKGDIDRIIARDYQLSVISNFIQSILLPIHWQKYQQKQILKQKVLIIQGLPNTGKTLSLQKALYQNQICFQNKQYKFIIINANKLYTPENIYVKLINELLRQKFKINEYSQALYKKLQYYFQTGFDYQYNVRNQVKKILIIDQVNEVNFFTQKIYEDLLFRWPQFKKSNLYVIFIFSELNLQKKLPSSYEDIVLQNKLEFQSFDSQKLYEILSTNLKFYSALFPKKLIKQMSEQFTNHNMGLKQCFQCLTSIVNKRETQKQESQRNSEIRKIQEEIQVKGIKKQQTISDKVIKKEEELKIDKIKKQEGKTIKVKIEEGTQKQERMQQQKKINQFQNIEDMKPFTIQQIINEIKSKQQKQIKEDWSLTSDFQQFPQSYKIVLMCIIGYFQFYPSNLKKGMKFRFIYFLLRKHHFQSQNQLWEILYDLKSLRLIDLQCCPNINKLKIDKRTIPFGYKIGLKMFYKRKEDQDLIKLKLNYIEMKEILAYRSLKPELNFIFDYDSLRKWRTIKNEAKSLLNQEQNLKKQANLVKKSRYDMKKQQNHVNEQQNLCNGIFNNVCKVQESESYQESQQQYSQSQQDNQSQQQEFIEQQKQQQQYDR